MCHGDSGAFGAQRRSFGMVHNGIKEGEVAGEGESKEKWQSPPQASS